MIKIFLITLNIGALIASIFWYYKSKEIEPIVSILTLISTLIVLLFTNKKNLTKIKLNQKGGKNSKNYQSAKKIVINQSDKKDNAT